MFISRLISCIVLLAILLCAFLIKGTFGIVVIFICGVFLSIFAVNEFSRLVKNIDIKVYTGMTATAAVLIFLGLMFSFIFSWNIDIALLILGLFAIYCWVKVLLSKENKESLTTAAASAGILLMIVVPLNCVTVVYLKGYYGSYIGVNLILLLILATKSGDIGAYCFGTIMSKRASGNHKIVPTISPKKSWEGAIGGMVLSIIVTCVLIELLDLGVHINIFVGILLGILLFWGGFFGDLSESALKRITGIKDSGAIIPGIGGVLDLIDSLLLNAPLFYLFIKVLDI